MESPFCVCVDIEVVLLLGKIPEAIGVRNGAVGVEDPLTESGVKEELHLKIGVLLLDVRETRNLEAVSIPGLKDWEFA